MNKGHFSMLPGLLLVLGSFLLLYPGAVMAQPLLRLVTGEVKDAESHQFIQGANVICETCLPRTGTTTDSAGRFKLVLPIGRHMLKISHISYVPCEVEDIQVTSGKMVVIHADMHEQIIQTGDIDIRGNLARSINPMATVSVRTLRSQDANRYAGGYFDPLRMVVNFAGVSSGNSDDNNEIVIRGNSPRGLLWRLEGIEIPNPNHFAGDQGASGGGFSSITTEVLSNFDFMTGSFPAEYGNALSGVMDLALREGNTEKHEHSFMLSVLGASLTSEGPLFGKNKSSYLASFRRADFRYLDYFGLYDKEEMSIVPRATDWALHATLKTKVTGNFHLFSTGAFSYAGDVASLNSVEIRNGGDTDEFTEDRKSGVNGVRHVIDLRDHRTYISTTVAHTWEFSSDINANTDSTLVKTRTYNDRFKYHSFRFSTLLNHKFSSRNSLRTGMIFNFLTGDMFARKFLKGIDYDTLIDTRKDGWYGGIWAQWKYKTEKRLELNSGFHLMISGITHEVVLEPRFGLQWKISDRSSLKLGSGFHSRHDPLALYNYRVKIDKVTREARNSDLKTSKAFHLSTGFAGNLTKNLLLNAEIYCQFLYSIPVYEYPTGTYSTINLSEGLPDVLLSSIGKGKNRGIELTLEKGFSDHYYFLATMSLFDSKYKAPNGYWFNTFYNTNFVCNILAGKEFLMGKFQQNLLGLKIKGLYRGGFRYTPVNRISTFRNKRIVYSNDDMYGARLPDFRRLDAGVYFRINRQKHALIFMCDIQNVMNTRNVLRRKFEFLNQQIFNIDSKSMGMIPVLSVKAEF